MSADRTHLIEYVLGILDTKAREHVERELQTSPESRRELAELEELLSNIALAVEPMHPTEQLRQRILSSLQPETRFESYVNRLTQFFDLGADRVRELLATVDAVSDQPWEDSGIPGTRFLHFDGGQRIASAHCGLVHIEPGEGIPKHQHFGNEWTFVLQGRLQEDSGQIWTSGDIVHRAPGSAHTICAVGNEPCLFAAVLYGKFELSVE